MVVGAPAGPPAAGLPDRHRRAGGEPDEGHRVYL